MYRYRIWSEFVPFSTLSDPSVLRLLEARSLELIVAVSEKSLTSIPNVLRACQDHGVKVGLWPLLSHAQGPWLNAHNLFEMNRFFQMLFQTLDKEKIRPSLLAFDLEPHFDEIHAFFSKPHRVLWQWLRRKCLLQRAQEDFSSLVHEAQKRNIPTLAAVFPLLIDDMRLKLEGWQRFLGTPTYQVGFDRINFMLYSSPMEGYFTGLSRTDVLHLFYAYCSAIGKQFPLTASASLGVVQGGVMGNERGYPSTKELAEDVGIAKASGISDFALYSLDGILMRPPIEKWLDTLIETPPVPPSAPPSIKAKAIWHAVNLTARPLDFLMKWRDK